MSNLINFNFENQTVRVELQDGEPLFCLRDVANILDIQNVSQIAMKQLDQKGVYKIYTLTDGGKQEVTFINEPNLYRVIFRSNKKEAVKFQNWVFEEVLPSIRKTGKYEAISEPKIITPQSLTDLTPITPFKSHLSAADWNSTVQEGERLVQLLYPLIDQLAECYYDKSGAYAQIKATIAHYCGIKNFHWITLERLPTALNVLAVMKSEAVAHKKMMDRLDANGRLALSYKTFNAIGYTGETFDTAEV